MISNTSKSVSDSAVELVGDLDQVAIDVVVEMAETTFEIANAAVDGAERLISSPSKNSLLDASRLAFEDYSSQV
ncbi:MAG: hypothetical protein OEM29_08930 [Thermoplasmata archaeon]|nr:hypothetical protein [Thermoplasmata archaeon]